MIIDLIVIVAIGQGLDTHSQTYECNGNKCYSDVLFAVDFGDEIDSEDGCRNLD